MLDASPAADAPVRPPVVSVRVVPDAPEPRGVPPKPRALLAAAAALLPRLEAGQALDAPTLREVLTRAFGGSDAQGAWVWKDAYEAAEAALVLFLKRWGRTMRREAGSPEGMLAMLEALAALEPSHTRRSEGQVARQQFSTPLPLAYAVLQAARVRPGGRGAGTVRRDRDAGGARRVRAGVPGRGGAAPERARRRAGGDAGRAVPRSVRDPLQRRGHRGLPAPCAALGGAHEPAVLHHPGRGPQAERGGLAPRARGLLHAPPGRAAGGRHRARLPAGRPGLGRRLRAPGPAPAHRLLGRGGRARLRPARDGVRDPPHRRRPRPRADPERFHRPRRAGQ